MKINDDRGLKCRIYPAWSAFWLMKFPKPIRKRIELRLVNLGAVTVFELSMFATAVGSMILIAALVVYTIKPWPFVALIVAFQLGLHYLGEHARGNQSRRARRAVAIRRVILAEERCASCAYSLVGIPAEDDACTVCPECGAAWRLDPTDIAGTRALAGTANYPPEITVPPHTTASTGFPPNS